MRREWSLREGPISDERKMVVSVEMMSGMRGNHDKRLEVEGGRGGCKLTRMLLSKLPVTK